jgi:hypothetical protein
MYYAILTFPTRLCRVCVVVGGIAPYPALQLSVADDILRINRLSQ